MEFENPKEASMVSPETKPTFNAIEVKRSIIAPSVEMSETVESPRIKLLPDEIGPAAEVEEEVEEKAAEKKADETAEPEEQETAEEPEKEAKPEKELPKGVQKRINEMTRKQREAERRAEAAEAELARIRSQKVEKTEETEAAEKKIPAKPEPKVDDYSDYDQYMKALARWEAEQMAEQMADKKIKEFKAEQEHQRMAEEAARQDVVVEEKMNVGREKYEDFDEVALSADVPYNDATELAVLSLPNSADVAYYLGQHLDEAQRITKLKPIDAVLEIGQISERLKTADTKGKGSPQSPEKKRLTKAPAPINALGGGASGSEGITGHESNEAYRAKRMAGMGR